MSGVARKVYPLRASLRQDDQQGSRTETPARCNSAFNSRESVTPK